MPKPTTNSPIPIAVGLAVAATVSLYASIQGWRNRSAFDFDELPFAGVLLWLATASPLISGWAWLRLRGQPVGLSTALRIAFVALVSTWLAYVLGIGGFHRVRVEVTLAAGCGGFAAALLVAARPATRWRAGVMLALFNLCLFAALGELSLRGLRWLRPSPMLTSRSSQVEERIRAHAFSPGETHLGFRCNSLGYYDAEFSPRDERHHPAVAVLGDSFSGSVVPHGLHYTTVCEQHVDGVEVWNVGWPSIGPDEYLHLLRRDVLPLEPDAIVIALFLGNDYAEVRPHDSIDRNLASFFDRGNTLLLELPRRLSVIAHAAAREAHPNDELPASSLARMRTLQPWLDDYRLEPATMSEKTYHGVAQKTAGIYGVWSAKRWTALTRRIRQMRSAAGSTPFGLLLIPDEAMIEDSLWQRTKSALGIESLERDGLRQRLVAFCGTEDIPCLDSHRALRSVPAEPDGDRHLYLRRDTHWNARGNRVAGRALAPFVSKLLRAPPR